MRQADIVEAIRGLQPPSPLALKLIDRFNRMAADNARFKALEQQATQNLEPPGGDMKRGSFLRDRAMEKMLDGGPEAADRLEARAAAAINASNWDSARQLLRWRLEMWCPLEPNDRASIDRIFQLMDEAEAKGIGPPCTATPAQHS